MALTKFVANVEDLSDDGGYKFRFHCDCCQDGFESQYVSASSNLLKTAISAFGMFNPLGYRAERVAQGVDRGLRGKERDRAYEEAVNKAMLFFKKCTACGKWVCPEACFNGAAGLCEKCAPNTAEQGQKAHYAHQAEMARQRAVAPGYSAPGPVACPNCQATVTGGKFCAECGTPLAAKKACKKCGHETELSAKFCAECGEPNR
jgi:hypothetical protein